MSPKKRKNKTETVSRRSETRLVCLVFLGGTIPGEMTFTTAVIATWQIHVKALHKRDEMGAYQVGVPALGQLAAWWPTTD